jgi:hypothetical protein
MKQDCCPLDPDARHCLTNIQVIYLLRQLLMWNQTVCVCTTCVSVLSAFPIARRISVYPFREVEKFLFSADLFSFLRDCTESETFPRFVQFVV